MKTTIISRDHNFSNIINYMQQLDNGDYLYSTEHGNPVRIPGTPIVESIFSNEDWKKLEKLDNLIIDSVDTHPNSHVYEKNIYDFVKTITKL